MEGMKERRRRDSNPYRLCLDSLARCSDTSYGTPPSDPYRIRTDALLSEGQACLAATLTGQSSPDVTRTRNLHTENVMDSPLSYRARWDRQDSNLRSQKAALLQSVGIAAIRLPLTRQAGLEPATCASKAHIFPMRRLPNETPCKRRGFAPHRVCPRQAGASVRSMPVVLTAIISLRYPALSRQTSEPTLASTSFRHACMDTESRGLEPLCVSAHLFSGQAPLPLGQLSDVQYSISEKGVL